MCVHQPLPDEEELRSALLIDAPVASSGGFDSAPHPVEVKLMTAKDEKEFQSFLAES